MTSFVQKLLVDSNHQEFAMKQTRKKYVAGIEASDWPESDWFTSHYHIIFYFIIAYQS